MKGSGVRLLVGRIRVCSRLTRRVSRSVALRSQAPEHRLRLPRSRKESSSRTLSLQKRSSARVGLSGLLWCRRIGVGSEQHQRLSAICGKGGFELVAGNRARSRTVLGALPQRSKPAASLSGREAFEH
jgi:hypothetical protein